MAEDAEIAESCKQGDAVHAGRQLATHLARPALVLLASMSPTFEPRAVRPSLRNVNVDA
jgi:hypothetical protein